MIGFLRGEVPRTKGDLLSIRREVEGKTTAKGYMSASGPVLRDALAAIQARSSFLDFLVAAQRLVLLPAPLRLASVTTERVAGLGPKVGSAARSHARLWGEARNDLGRTWAFALIPKETGKAFGNDIVSLLNELIPKAAATVGRPDNRDLSALSWAQLEAMARDSGGILSTEMPGLLWLAASAMQPPSAPGASLLVGVTNDVGREQRAYGHWLDEPEVRRLYEAKSKEALVDAARQAAIRDTHVDPPSHECLPEICSLLLPQSRQLTIDDETDLLAVEFLLGPLGLLPPEGRAEVDWIRRLEAPEVDAILKRLGDLNELSADELFAQAGRYLYPDRGGSDEGGYAGELQGAIREWVEELFAKAAKKKEAITLVACEDWLGSKKA